MKLKTEIVNQDQVFDEVILAKEFWLFKVKVWKEEEIKTKKNITSEEKWLQLNYTVILLIILLILQ